MVYRFKLVSDEVSNFSREIEIDSENTFLQLRNCILECLGFSKDELESFFICDEDWEKHEEIALVDMGAMSSDQDLWTMDTTTIGEMIDEEGQRMIFVFDYLTERCLFMELKEIIPHRSMSEPICTIKRGVGPKQHIDMDIFEAKLDQKAKESVESIDIDDVVGDQSFDDEDIEDGYDIMEMGE